ncbi:MAG: oligosaccharide flippase family protein [Candidatus Aminicenantes bacterium]|nr:MAG: oligosaccharide flippase family protein [Candidatus Aminicenantes bacterium]
MNNQNAKKPAVSDIGVSSIAKNTIYLIGGRWLTTVIQGAYAIVLARMLGPELYGLYNYGLSWYMAFILFATLGLAAVLSREVGRDFEGRSKVVDQTFLIRLFTSIFVAVLSGCIGFFTETDPRVKYLLLLFSVALVGRSLALWAKEVFNAYESNRYYLIQQALFRPLEVLVGIIVLIAGGNIIAVAAVHALSWWLQALGGFLFIAKRITVIKIRWSWRTHRKILSQGFVICLNQFMIFWPPFGVVILFRFLGGTDFSLGQLALILGMFWVAFRIPESSSVAALPVLSRAVGKGDGRDRLFTETVLRINIIFGATAGLGGLGLGIWLVTAVFGMNYELAGRLLGFAFLLLIPYGCGYSLYSVYLAQKRDLKALVFATIGATTFTLGMFMFAPRLHVPGALISLAIGTSIWMGSMIIDMAKRGQLSISFSIGKPGIAALLGLGVFSGLHVLNTWLALFSGLIVLFGGAILSGGLSSQEKDILTSLFRKKAT